MYKRSFGIVLVLLLLGGGIWWLQAAPPPATTKDTGPTISWSVPTLTGTMFPGTSSTTVVTFRSNQNVAGVVVEATPSLAGIVSVSPTTFHSITANQNYRLTFTLKAPVEFETRSFEGTILIRNNEKPPNAYAKPLDVALTTDWDSTSTAMGILIKYPAGWLIQSTATEIAAASPTLQNLTQSQDAEVPPYDFSVRVFPKPEAEPLVQFASTFDEGWFNNYGLMTAPTITGHNAIIYSDASSPVPHQPILAAFIDDPAHNQVLVATMQQVTSTSFATLFIQLLSGLEF